MTNTTPPRMDSGAPMDGLSVPTDGAPGSTCLPLGMAEAPAVVLAAELNYRGAWERVLEKSGMPGTDGVTTSRFKRMADGALKNLEADLAGGVYRPLPLRMAQLEKKSGGALRLLLVPSVVDRVAQTAVAQWLGAKWNPIFDRASYAYRPGTGVHAALRRLHELRDQGFRWVLDADIRSFFDSIDHSSLLQKLTSSLGASSGMLGWLESWLKVSAWDGAELLSVPQGVPQGSPLSPLLANFYMHEFDVRLRSSKVHFIRYADDFLVLARTPFELSEARSVVEEALADLKLTLSEEKTRTVTFDQCFRFLGAEMQHDNIFLPFEKKKEPLRPVYIAPVMPPALLRAYKAGHLKASKPLVWTGERDQTPKPKATPPSRSAKAYDAIRGGGKASSLKLLSGRK